jgi:hypothetical protein
VIKKYFQIILLYVPLFAGAQKLKKEDKQLVANLQQHIQYLADDKLEGRRTGTAGEKMAVEYIAGEFRKTGLQPKGSAAFYQPFEIQEGKQVNTPSHLIIDGNNLVLHKEYFPLSYSANASVEGLPSLSLQEANTPWFLDVKDLAEGSFSNPHLDLDEAVVARTREISKKGATALLLFNSGSSEDWEFDGKKRLETVSIPVLYISKEAAKKYIGDPSATLDVKLKVDISDKKRTGTNVIGYMDNGAAHTVVLGAHLDHLGYGEDKTSLAVGQEKAIHNGADDNASGTAALIELARLLKASKLKNNNFLFIAFSGEEAGLYGSKYFTEHPTVPLEQINYMINMDMVGRLPDSVHALYVGGYGTSPSWGSLYQSAGKVKLYQDDLVFRFDSSGTGPSDHTSFYLKNIPVLFYFTGLHSDYHKPTDDPTKINYTGEMLVLKHIYSLIQATDKLKQKLAFTKTRETAATTSARFSVTLGILPDYSFSGAGVRVDGVSDNRPAQKAGLQAGDVITGLGEYQVRSLETYMQALGKFKKGDRATVRYSRKNEALSATVEF